MDPFGIQKGLLFLIGGAEDRKGEKIVLRTIVERTKASKIAIIPTASDYPQDVFRTYDDAFRALGVRNVDYLDIRYRDEADRREHLRIAQKADLVFFGGGDQVKLVEILNHTRLFFLINRRFETGDLHLAGTSAGATAAGNAMLYNGNHSGLCKGSVDFAKGFGFISGVAIDTHFSERGRLLRLSQFLINSPCQKGIGLDEDTCIMICPNLQFSVIGSGMVTVLNSTKISGSNYHTLSKGEKLRFNNMRLGMLPTGSMFSLRKWSIMSRVGINNQCRDSLARRVVN